MDELIKLIEEYAVNPPPRTALAAEADGAFINRANIRSPALTMEFWARHFEWEEVLHQPKISGHILDFGCGSGHSDIMIARAGKKITGVDISPLGILIANHILKKEAPEVQERASFIQADVTQAVAPKLYDSVWASHVFEHIKDPTNIFGGLKNWVKPAAPILISVPLGHAYDCPRHIHHWFSTDDIKGHFGKFLAITSISISSTNQVIRIVGTIK